MADAGAGRSMQERPDTFDLVTEPYAALTAAVVVPQILGEPRDLFLEALGACML